VLRRTPYVCPVMQVSLEQLLNLTGNHRHRTAPLSPVSVALLVRVLVQNIARPMRCGPGKPLVHSCLSVGQPPLIISRANSVPPVRAAPRERTLTCRLPRMWPDLVPFRAMQASLWPPVGRVSIGRACQRELGHTWVSARLAEGFKKSFFLFHSI
jgi:hypothetical protein